MAMSNDPVWRGSGNPNVRRGSGLRPVHAVGMALAVVIVGYLLIHFISAVIGGVIEAAIVIGILYALFRLLTRHRRS
jgi:uncharacterized protein (DUF697 family)